MPHAGRTPMALEKQSRFWQLEPCSQRAGENVNLSKKTTEILRCEKRLSRGRRCRLLNYKTLITGMVPDMQNVAPYKMVAPTDEINGQRKVRQMLGPTPLDQNHAILGRLLS